VTVPSGCSFVSRQHVNDIPSSQQWDTVEVPCLFLANQAARHAEIEKLFVKDNEFKQLFNLILIPHSISAMQLTPPLAKIAFIR
jgi:hypothetical protein